MNLIQELAVAVLPILFAITVHEVAHGWVANRLGDRTALMMGRLTLNPVKHIDPIGTVLVPILMYAYGGFIFGWAKPVPITTRNLRQPRRDMALISAAGPLANLLMALAWALVGAVAVAIRSPETLWVAEPLRLMGQLGVLGNVTLMVLNLLPLPPLDGSRVAASFMSGPLAYKYESIESYGLIILMALFVTGGISYLIGPPIGWLVIAIFSIFGL